MAGVAGIVAEFNPFHNGHAALVQAAREEGAQTVAAVMSGNFVQRGSPAVTDKRVRTKAALLSGVDLVLELPVAYATAPARRFASGAVEILAAVGCVGTLCFGSECGDAGALRALAAVVDSPGLQPVLREQLAQGVTYARARQNAVELLEGEEAAALLAGPNNTLAVEYLRAARQIGWSPQVQTVKRLGAAHDSPEAEGRYASASMLRTGAEDFALLRRHVPPSAAAVYAEAFGFGLYPAVPEKLDIAVLAHLRRLSRDELALLPDLSEGLENRLYAAIRQARMIEELECALKTKRYTLARVRRLILAAFLGVTRADTLAAPPYVRVLGATPRGMELLARMKETCRLPVSHSLARLREHGGVCGRFTALEALATDLYALALPRPPACGYEYTASAVFPK